MLGQSLTARSSPAENIFPSAVSSTTRTSALAPIRWKQSRISVQNRRGMVLSLPLHSDTRSTAGAAQLSCSVVYEPSCDRSLDGEAAVDMAAE